jgi:hypothetical protein
MEFGSGSGSKNRMRNRIRNISLCLNYEKLASCMGSVHNNSTVGGFSTQLF